MRSHVKRTLLDISKFLPRLLPISLLLFLASCIAVYSLAFSLNDGGVRSLGKQGFERQVAFLSQVDTHKQRIITTPQQASPTLLESLAQELQKCSGCQLHIEVQGALNRSQLPLADVGADALILVTRQAAEQTNIPPAPIGSKNYGQTVHLLPPEQLPSLPFLPLADTVSLPQNISCSCSAQELATLASHINEAYRAEGLTARFYAYENNLRPYTLAQWTVAFNQNLPFFLPLLLLLVLSVAANAALWKLLRPSYQLQCFYGAHWLVLLARYLFFVGLAFTLPIYTGFAFVDRLLRSGGGYSAPPWVAGGGALLPLVFLAALLLVAAPGVLSIYRLSRKERIGDSPLA